MKIITVLGARPQFIKAAALSRALRRDKALDERIIHTGQHYDKNMSEIFFDQMQIPKPHYFLQISSQAHGAMTGRMIEAIETVLKDEKPDLVMVYGDTNSTLAGAIAAKKLNIKLAHVEAGLRSFNNRMPEEINRIITDRISDLLFCPGAQAEKNLTLEGFNSFDCKVYQVGDIMKDVAYFYREFDKAPSFRVPEKFVLATIHRAENTDDVVRLKSIIEALSLVAQDLPVVLPLHPRTRNMCESLQLKWPSSVLLQDPVGYLEMIHLLQRCRAVITDSGGLQKEAYFFEKPCITIRDQTEWTELVEGGYNDVVGVSKEKILKSWKRFNNEEITFNMPLYGDGKTAERIVGIIKQDYAKL